MNIQCDCGKFHAELTHFPKRSTGRLFCYCDDCQKFLNKIQRQELLDEFGGTQVITVYPNDVKFTQGKEFLKCNRLSQKGLSRWVASCCNTPIANTIPKFPWVAIYHNCFTNVDKDILEKLGPVKSRIMGKFKVGTPPFPVSDKLNFKDYWAVGPFIFKGMLLKKYIGSPFYQEDSRTPISKPEILD